MGNIILVEKLNERIKRLRKEHGMTQEELAEYIKIGKENYKTIRNWEKGKNIPSLEFLISMSKCFNVSLDYLTCQSDDLHLGNKEFSKLTGLSTKAIEVLRYATLPEHSQIESDVQAQNKRTVSFINRALESVSVVDEKDGGRRSVETIFSVMEDYVCSTGAWIEDKRTGEAVPSVTVNFNSSESSVITVREFLSVHLLERIRNVLDALRHDHDEMK